MVCVRCRPGVSLPAGVASGPSRKSRRRASSPRNSHRGLWLDCLRYQCGHLECMCHTCTKNKVVMGGVRAAQGGRDPERVRFLPVSADTFVRVRLGVGSSDPWGKRWNPCSRAAVRSTKSLRRSLETAVRMIRAHQRLARPVRIRQNALDTVLAVTSGATRA